MYSYRNACPFPAVFPSALVAVVCVSAGSQQARARFTDRPPVERCRHTQLKRGYFRLVPRWQPTPDGLRTLAKMGVDIIVDGRFTGAERERQEANRLGMRFASLPWHRLFPRDEVFAKFVKLLQDNRGKKLFVHCRFGDEPYREDRRRVSNGRARVAVGRGEEANGTRLASIAWLPSLERYERSFPEPLKNEPDFESLGINSESAKH